MNTPTLTVHVADASEGREALDALVSLLRHPHCADDLRTLRHVQAARARIVDAACTYADDPDTWSDAMSDLLAAVREYRRITAPPTRAA